MIKEHPKVGSTVRVIKEQAGISCYGKTGSLSDISGSQATIFSAQGSISTNISNIVVENPEWKPPAKYKTLSYVTRKQLQAMLDAAGCIHNHGWMITIHCSSLRKISFWRISTW